MEKHAIQDKTPEEFELEKKQQEFNTLMYELGQKELEHVTLLGELRVFETRYMQNIGTRLAELDEVEAQISEKLAARSPSDFKLREVTESVRAKARESRQAANFSSKGKSFPLKFKPSEDLKNLYREIAKQIHPDLAVDEKDRIRREELMKRANEAFHEGDEEKLKSILSEWKSSPESVIGEGVGAELIRLIRQISLIKIRIVSIEEEITKHKASDLHQLMIKINNAEKIGQDLISQMVSNIDRLIKEKRDYLDKLMTTI